MARFSLAVLIPFCIIVLIVSLPFSSSLAANKDSSNVSGNKHFTTEFDFAVSYRVDDLDWNIAADITGTATPNILSELTWEDLEIFQLKAKNRTTIGKFVALKGQIAYGWIFEGENQDSDYLGNDRTLEFSRSNNSTDDGDVLDLSGGLGVQFNFKSDFFSVVPMVGYSYHEQNLKITDGVQTIPATGPFANLDSSYDTEWYGPWIGVDLIFRSSKKEKNNKPEVTLITGLEYHWAEYEAVADWNLRTDFMHPKSFEHEVDDANGFVFNASLGISVNRYLGFNLGFDYQNWWTDDGIDRIFFSNGTISETRLNEVNWQSYAWSIGAVVSF